MVSLFFTLQQPAADEILINYIQPYNNSEVTFYTPIETAATPSISSYRSIGDYSFYNVYSNYPDGENVENTGDVLRYSCWDAATARYKSNQCNEACKYAYNTVCQLRRCNRQMIQRALALCKYLCAAEFE